MNHFDLQTQLIRSKDANVQAQVRALNARFNDPTSKMTCGELDRAVGALVGFTISYEMQDEDCDSPAWLFWTWAETAIDGRQYKRRSGPDVRWTFRMADGKALEISPRYIPREEYERRFGDVLIDSNWQFDDSFGLRVFAQPKDRRPIARGSFYSEELYSTGAQELTDAIVSRLWEIHRDPENAFAGMPWCGVCHRALTDETSRRIGIGPECAHKLRISHGQRNARVAELNRRDARN